MFTNFGEKNFFFGGGGELKVLKGNGMIIQKWTLIKIMYFIRLIVKERPFPQHNFLILYLCFLIDDGRMGRPKRLNKSK